MDRVLLVLILTGIIQAVDTLAYSVRLAGVITGRLATALSLFNIIALVSRTANLVQGPLLGSLVDTAIVKGHTGGLLYDYRLIIVGASAGALVGAAAIPTFVQIFVKGIRALDEAGSISGLLRDLVSVRLFYHLREGLRSPAPAASRHLRAAHGLPKTFLILNVLITAIYTVGVLAAVFAGALVPEYRSTANQLSGLINGIATILFVVAVDPISALITDQAMAGKRPKEQVTTMVAFLALTKVAGTILAQLAFLPASDAIVWVSRWINGQHP